MSMNYLNKIDTEVQKIAAYLHQKGAKVILVGGCIRDLILGLPIKDYDIEIYHIPDYNTLKTHLEPFGKVNEIGKSFGIVKLTTPTKEIDFSFPRKERKTAPGHKGFQTEFDPNMSYEQAASRRDFTINSMGLDLITGELLDPNNGLQDIKTKTLRHIGPAFSEDPLRALRAMQFIARFSLQIAPETLTLCSEQNLDELPRERLFEEFKKCLLLAKKPSLGFEYLRASNLISYFPEIQALIDVPQDPEWHPEGDVWIHTLMVLDEQANLRTGDAALDLELMFAALCHDLGKPPTTEKIDGRWRSRMHDEEGVPLTETFLHRLTDDKRLIDTVKSLVKEHLKPAQLYNESERQNVSDAAIRRLSCRVTISKLIILGTADHRASGGRSSQDPFPAGEWLAKRAEELAIKDSAPEPIIMGRHLIEWGLKPGKEMGDLLKALYDAQLNGDISTVSEGKAALEALQKKL